MISVYDEGEYLLSHYTIRTGSHFNHVHCMQICYTLTEHLCMYTASYNLHMSQRGWVLINIFYARVKV